MYFVSHLQSIIFLFGENRLVYYDGIFGNTTLEYILIIDLMCLGTYFVIKIRTNKLMVKKSVLGYNGEENTLIAPIFDVDADENNESNLLIKCRSIRPPDTHTPIPPLSADETRQR